MLLNYIKLAWRNLRKNRVYSLVNIIGLAMGLACFILIALYVLDEWSFDRFHKNAKNIYRVDTDITFGGSPMRMAVTSDPMGAALKADYPDVSEFTRVYSSSGSKLIRKDDRLLNEDKVAYADSSFFRVFDFNVVDGNLSTALNEPNCVVISQTAARKYFGDEEALGRELAMGSGEPVLFKVTGVIEDMPQNSHMRFDMLFSMANAPYEFGNYLSHNFATYLLLKDGTDPAVFESRFKSYLDKYVLPQAKAFMNINSIEEFESAGNSLKYELMPLTDIHLYSDKQVELGVNGSIKYVYIFSAVALFILLIACINFMNLSTARSAHRAREVGIRKVLGTGRSMLIAQFLIEATIMVILALAAALGIVKLAGKYFSEISGKEIDPGVLQQPSFLLFLLLLPLLVGTLAGFYPAFFLSSFKPIAVLKGQSQGVRRSRLRSGLVVFQFMTTIFLVIATVVVYRQLNFIQTTKIGFNRDQVMVVGGTYLLGDRVDAFSEEVSKLNMVTSSAYAGFLPVSSSSRTDYTFFTSPGLTPETGFSMQAWQADYNYIPTLGIEMKYGRNFNPTFGSDSTALVINETAAALMGTDNPVGKKLYIKMTDVGEAEPTEMTIVGVMKNFHYESLRQEIGPVSLMLGYNKWAAMFRVSAANLPLFIDLVKEKWDAMGTGMPFQYEFLDDAFNNMYRAEQRVGKVAVTFTVLAIVIACLGLFGLAAFMAEQRTREVGIRKVLGAGVLRLAGMLSYDFARLVLLASVIALPLSYLVMHRWLQDFSYRTALNWWIFALAALATLIIAMVTVGMLAIRAAKANPVKSLKTGE